MNEFSPRFRLNEASGRRSGLTLPCFLHLPDQEIEAVTSSISYGGIGIELAPGNEKFIPELLSAVTVEGMGRFEVDTRWRKGCSVGVAFSCEAESHHLLDAYLGRNGI